MLRRADSLEGFGGSFYNVLNVELYFVEEQFLCVELVQGEEIAGQVSEPLRLEQDDMKIFPVQFRGDRAVSHGFHVSLDRSEGGAEIVGDIRHDFFLVVIHIFKLRGHIVQGGGQIAHLVVGVDRDLIVQIPHCILLGRFCNLPQGPVDEEVETDQESGGQQENHGHGNVDCNHDRTAALFYAGDRTVDKEVALCGKSLSYRGHHGDYFFVEVSVEISGNVLAAADFRRIKFFNCLRSRCPFHIGGGDHIAILVHEPERGVQIKAHGCELGLYCRDRRTVIEIGGKIIAGDQSSLPVKRAGGIFRQSVSDELCGEGARYKQTEKAEYDIKRDKFQMKDSFHNRISHF